MKGKIYYYILLSIGLCISIEQIANAQEAIDEENFYLTSYSFIYQNWNQINPYTRQKEMFLIDSVEFISNKYVFNFPMISVFENQELIKKGFIDKYTNLEIVHYYHSQKLLSDTFAIKPFYPEVKITPQEKLLIKMGFYGIFKYSNEFFVIVGFTDLFYHHSHKLIIKMDENRRVLDYSYFY